MDGWMPWDFRSLLCFLVFFRRAVILRGTDREEGRFTNLADDLSLFFV